MMKNIYLAIWYKCNQKCLGCPCGLNDNKDMSLTLEQITSFLEKYDPEEAICVTLSGGEPTLHPQFFEILEELKRRNIYVAILTNSEMFAKKDFADGFLKHISLDRTRIITTIHSSEKELHERQNGTKGSFDRTMSGLKYLFFRGVNITVKHCITGVNYKNTADFIRFIDNEFHPSVDLQLFGIDYCGLSKEEAASLYVPFYEMTPWLEAGLDTYLELSEFNKRRISIKNIPLCAVDPYYWELLYKNNHEIGYSGYADPSHSSNGTDDNSGTNSHNCELCCVREMCQGTYKSMVEYFGDDSVRPITPME